MKRTDIYKTYIELEVSQKGIIQKIVSGQFALEEFKPQTSIYDVCTFLEVTLDGLIEGQVQSIEGMVINSLSVEYNIDVELFLDHSLITILIQDRSNLYKIVRALNQDRNDFFIAKSLINKQNKELEKLRAIAEKSSEEKSQFLAVLSHEIRNPLNIILGFGGIIETESQEEKIKEHSHNLTRAAEGLKTLVNDLLNLSIIESGKIELALEPFSLIDVIDTTIKNFEILIKNNDVVLNTQTDKSLPKLVLGDSLRFSQIISNLISNALKFTKKGSVTLKTSIITETTTDIIIHFSIEDTGRGIAKETIEKIFLAYEQTELNDSRVYGGSGLGLSIVKHLVESMKGEIKVESEIGIGSTFSFQIPFKKDNSIGKEKVNSKTISTNKVDFTNLEILIADDDMLSQTYSNHILQKTGAHVTIASDGLEAISQLKIKKFDVVLLDINMPNMSGQDVIKRKNTFTELNKTTVFIAITANAFKSSVNDFLNLGFSAVLSKPYTPEELYKIILQLVFKKN